MNELNYFLNPKNTTLDEKSSLSLISLNNTDELFLVVDKNRSYLKEWLPWLDHNTNRIDTEKFIQSSIVKFNGNKAPELVIKLQDKIVGCIGLHEINWNEETTAIGYWLAQDAQGLGLITKSCQALLNYCFKELTLKKVYIRCATENIKSRAIPKRLGFIEECTKEKAEWLYDHFVDHVVYAITKESYTLD